MIYIKRKNRSQRYYSCFWRRAIRFFI